MNAETLVRALSLCVVLASAETLHGIARTVLVVPRLGKERAIRLSAFTGSALALLICLWLVPPMGLKGATPHLLLGLTASGFMAAFDIGIGRLVMRKSWEKIWPDFDPRTGNYLVFGLAFLIFAPLLAAHLAGLRLGQGAAWAI